MAWYITLSGNIILIYRINKYPEFLFSIYTLEYLLIDEEEAIACFDIKVYKLYTSDLYKGDGNKNYPINFTPSLNIS